MIRKPWFFVFLMVGVFIGSCAKKPQWPGRYDWGTLLPNRWVLTPAGKQIPVGDLPLNMALSPDGALLAVTNNGYSKQFISLIDAKGDSALQKLPVKKAFYGLAFSSDGQRLYASGGGDHQILIWHRENGQWQEDNPISLRKDESQRLFVCGIALTAGGRELLAAENLNGTVSAVDLQRKQVKQRVQVGPYPYDVKALEGAEKAYVSLWGGSAVAVLRTAPLQVQKKIPVGEHPNTMVFTPDKKRLFVACANTDDIWAIDTQADTVLEVIGVHPYAGAPFGSTPNGLAVSPDGKTLYVPNADNNDVCVIDISRPGKSRILGLIPVGWYPTAVAVSTDGSKIFVANGKGLQSKPNPKGPNPNKRSTAETQYIGKLFWGTVSVIPVPDGIQLQKYTRQVEKNNGFNEAEKRLTQKARAQTPHAVPRRVGEPSLIKHVIYIIKENRTYDQVFGDLPQGNGDSTLCLFGRDVTPNHHALAEEFVLLDNFYVDAEVSADGHEWSTGAIATDFVEKTWPTNYSGRGLPYPAEGLHEIAFPTSGYIWEAAARKGISYRSYGEFIGLQGDSTFARHPALVGHFDPHFRPWDLSYPDTLRAEEFLRELKAFEATGDLPALIVLRLPNDHTAGTRPGMPTPRAMVAENDLALGRLVQGVSRSKFWKETAIFVVEDDAQNGPDHVDAHRTVALVISPYVKRHSVNHTMYDTVSMLRTIELILGLPPLSQYDAAAIPMASCFTDKPDTAPYQELRPKVPLGELNSIASYGARESLAMDFSREDATPEIRLNEIIWKSIRGADSEMPRPVTHRNFVFDDDGDDE